MPRGDAEEEAVRRQGRRRHHSKGKAEAAASEDRSGLNSMARLTARKADRGMTSPADVEGIEKIAGQNCGANLSKQAFLYKKRGFSVKNPVFLVEVT